nr:reductive dehalogenase [Myxococcota bacterium]
VPWDNSKPGYTQKDRAMHHAAWYPLTVTGVEPMKFNQPNTTLTSWDQSDVEEEQYQFESPREAATSIKSAARVWGAVRCGITKRDRRWDYDPIYDIMNERTLTWEEDFPFEPKTVIVILVPEDYDNIQTAPAWTAEGAVGHGYVVMAQIANQVAKFMRGMGYHAVGAGNDLGNSVAYGIAAGLGQGGRNAQLLVPGLGPRHRICKVYTDFEDVEYDQPHDFGITEFCLSCGECAKSCPSGALPLLEDEDSGYGFQPKYEHSDEPGYTWSNHTGVKKFYSDAKKCFDFWIENDSACGNCIASCTYNEPDYWHHWLSMASTTIAPGFLHHTMSKMHPLFGYGATGDPAKVDKFWKSGEGMRINPSSKNNSTTAGKA